MRNQELWDAVSEVFDLAEEEEPKADEAPEDVEEIQMGVRARAKTYFAPPWLQEMEPRQRVNKGSSTDKVMKLLRAEWPNGLTHHQINARLKGSYTSTMSSTSVQRFVLVKKHDEDFRSAVFRQIEKDKDAVTFAEQRFDDAASFDKQKWVEKVSHSGKRVRGGLDYLKELVKEELPENFIEDLRGAKKILEEHGYTVDEDGSEIAGGECPSGDPGAILLVQKPFRIGRSESGWCVRSWPEGQVPKEATFVLLVEAVKYVVSKQHLVGEGKGKEAVQ